MMKLKIVKLLILSVLVLAFVLCPASTQNSGTRCQLPNGALGMCIGIRQCTPLLNMVEVVSLVPEIRNFLRQTQCGGEGKNVEVCCPTELPRFSTSTECDTNQITEKPVTTDIEEFENVQYNLSDYALLPTDCGKDLAEKIIGGERTEIDEFPWVAILEYKEEEEYISRCEGTLISKRYVVTAAHCIPSHNNDLRLVNVRLGEYNINTEKDCIWDGTELSVCADPPIVVGIEEQIVHENYERNLKNARHDIALLRLSQDVPFTNYVKPICLPEDGQVAQGLYASGWGNKESLVQSNVKLKVKLPLVDHNTCQEAYSTLGLRLVPSQICAGGRMNRDTCKGDSGGPLMQLRLNQDIEPKWRLVGVVSFGRFPCGLPKWPGIYTKVSNYVPWIASKMRP